MNNRETVQYSIDALLKTGADKAQCRLTIEDKNELNVDWGEISLLRTNMETKLEITAIVDDRKGKVTVGSLEKNEIDKAVENVMEIAKSSEADEANDISEKQPAGEFRAGPEAEDRDLMYERIRDFVDYVKENYPVTLLEGISLDFTKEKILFANSNGVEFSEDLGSYSLMVMFTSKEGRNVSSFNYSVVISKDLNNPLKDMGEMERLIKQSSEQTETEELPAKFTGDVIVTPECLGSILWPVTYYLGDYYMISGNSIFRDRLNEKIGSEKLTIHSRPTADDFSSNYFVTNDGFKAENSTIIKNGILKSFLLSQYGAKKTGLQRAVNHGGCYEVAAGDTSFDDMVKNIDKGILLCRFSGGMPSDNGDFSGVAKNSYYIENGEIKYPLRETMVTGNVGELISNIGSVSKEQVNRGYCIYPWVHFTNLNVSGK